VLSTAPRAPLRPGEKGRGGRDVHRQASSTSDDNRIERLTRENYRDGYFNPATLKHSARETIGEMLRGERAGADP
jgi:hypothetical protein